MTSIDPYGLLGATIDSSPSEVKRSYYALSLLVHPDKGGSAADMIMVHNAYKYVMAQVSEVNRTVTVEELEARFAAFCLSQTDLPPPISEMDFDTTSFHRAFERLPIGVEDGNAMRASMTGGYETFMESETSMFSDFQTQVVPFLEPETSTTDTRLTFSEMTHVDHMDDYGTDRPLSMMDYRAAYTATPEILPDASEMLMQRTFEQLACEHRDTTVF